MEEEEKEERGEEWRSWKRRRVERRFFFRWGLLYRGIAVIAQKVGYKQLKFESRL